MSGNLEQFLTELSRGLDRTLVSVNKELTLRTRVKRTWSMRQCARLLNVSTPYLNKLAKQFDDFPEGEYVGRERVFTVKELMHMRALLAGNAKRPYDYLAWRAKDDPPAGHLICESERRYGKVTHCGPFCAVSEPALWNARWRYGCRPSKHDHVVFCWR